eukprot:s1584_g16.t1
MTGDLTDRFRIGSAENGEVMKAMLTKSLPSVSDKEDEAAAADDDGIKDPRKIDLEADDIAQKPPLKVPKSLTWSEESIMRSRGLWLEAPQTVNWMYPMEAGPSSSSQNDAQESRPEATKAGVRFAATTDDDEDGLPRFRFFVMIVLMTMMMTIIIMTMVVILMVIVM